MMTETKQIEAVLDAVRRYMGEWGRLEQASEPDSGASVDDLQALWQKAEDARETLFHAFDELEDDQSCSSS